MKELFIFLIFFSTTLMELKAIENNYPLIPQPKSVKWTKEKFLLSNATSVNSLHKELNSYFCEQLKILTGISIVHSDSNSTSNKIIFSVANEIDKSNNEAYRLTVLPEKIEIIGSSETGLFRGIQTLFQLISPSDKANKKSNTIEIPGCIIDDKPVFSWRGLNLDCSRHFMSKDFIKRYIDILAYYKFNTFHWHLTDDQGWRIEIKKYPKLTEIGAWRKEGDGTIYGGFYTQEDIKEVVAYAQSRFINIVPEIEMPGHSLASLASYPENSCTGGPFEVATIWGVMKDIYCAGRDSTFFFLQDILDEVINLFPGKYIHIGGDEAPKDRWRECPKCQLRIKKEGLKDEYELQSYFIKRISAYLNSKGKEIIGWDEILQGGLAPGAIVQSWQSFQGAIDAARLGHRVISSPASHTYLNHDPEDLDLRIAYSFKPIPDELTVQERVYILGSEANLWTEYAPQETVDSKLFPRILALVEVFWNDPNNKDYDQFYSRVQKSYEDLTALGIKFGREGKVMTPITTYDDSKKEFTLTIERGQKDIEIHYTVNGEKPDANSALYSSPIKIKNTSIVNIGAFKNGHFIGKQYSLSFNFHKALNSKITLTNLFDERYRAGGNNGLIDGIRGTNNFRDRLWQGFEGVDFEGLIDLGEEKEISSVNPRFFFDCNSWIFLPVKVEIALSSDKINFHNSRIIVNDVPQKNSEILQKDFTAKFDKQKARYIKVKAESIKKCPDWHPGAGGKAWLMIDEVVVE
jgi:hexosaminidase